MSNCETIAVSPAAAAELRRTANFELQRPISESNVKRLEAEMRANRFVKGTPIYLGVLPNKSMVALNGNHTLEATSRCGKDVELTFIYQDVADLTEAAAIYSRLDLQKVRSWRDSLRAYDAETMLADSTAWTSAFAAAIGFMFERFRVSRSDNENELVRIQALRSRDIRLRAMHDAEVAATQYVQAVSNAADPKLYKRATVMAVGIELFRYQPADATRFFKSLSEDDGLRQGDPQRALLRYLREVAKSASARENQARAVALAWNAFKQDRKLEILRPNAMGEFRLEGTPWNKDFDPLKAYLTDLFDGAQADLFVSSSSEREAAEAETVPEETAPKVRRGVKGQRKIQRGVDHNLQPVAIYDKDPEFNQEQIEH